MNYRKTAKLLKAIANTNRLHIIAVVSGVEEINVTEINKRVRVSQPGLSQHLNILRKAGILKKRRQGREFYYSIDFDIFPLVEHASELNNERTA